MVRILKYLVITVAALFVAFILFMMVMTEPWIESAAQLVWHFLLGSIYYPIRVVPNLHLDAGNLISLAVALLFLTLGGHFFLRWVHASTGARARPWRWRWTLLLMTLVVTTLSFCISIGLVFHQIGWLITGRYSLIHRDYSRLPLKAVLRNPFDLGMAVIGSYPGHPEKTREDFVAHSSVAALLETYHVGIIENPDGTIFGFVVVPRDSNFPHEGVMAIIDEREAWKLDGIGKVDGDYITIPATSWPSALGALNAAALATTQPGGLIWDNVHLDSTSRPNPTTDVSPKVP